MLIAAAAALLVLVALNRHIGKTFLFPPALLSAIWALILLGLALSPYSFFPIHAKSLAVYLIGTTAFSLGGILCLGRPVPGIEVRRYSRRLVDVTLNIGLVVLIAGMPFYWDYLQELTQGSGMKQFFWSIRSELVMRSDLEGVKSTREFFIDALLGASVLLSILAFLENTGTWFDRARMYVTVTFGLIYNLATMSRTGPLLILGPIAVLTWFRDSRLRARRLAVPLAVMICAFLIAAFLREVGVTVEGSDKDSLWGVLDTIRIYLLAGPVAFDAYLTDPQSVPSVWSISRIFLHTANRFGAHFDVPSQHAEYTLVGPGITQNVYTMYFAYYPDFGLPGVVIILFVMGALCTWMYRRALAGDRVALVMYTIFAVYIGLSGFNEQFFNQLNFTVKALLFAMFLFRLPTAQFGRAHAPAPAG